MAENKFQVPVLGHMVDVTDVPISKSDEKTSEYVLEDGSTVRMKTVVTAMLRIDGQYNADGDPIYFARNSVIVTPVRVPQNLRKPG